MIKLLRKFGFIIAVIAFLLFTLTPIVWCFIVSISPESQLFETGKSFLPTNPTLSNYLILLDSSSHFGSSFINGITSTLKAVLLTLSLGIPVSVTTAYALSRINFAGKRIVQNILLLTIAIPVFTTIIPLYAIFADLGILGNPFAVSIVYVSSFLPLITWLLTNYFNSIPLELDEAAEIDGCSRWKILVHIILPNSLPILVAATLMIFLMTWNQYQIPLILGISDHTKPLSIVVADFSSKDGIYYGMSAASGVLSILPPAIIAILFGKSLVTGLTQGSIKG